MGSQTKVSDIMTRDVVVLLEENNLAEVAGSFERFHFHHLPVVDGEKLVGMVSQTDMLRVTLSGVDQGAPGRTRESRFLERTFVRDLMSARVLTARPDEPVQSAVKRMLEGHVSALPVVDAEQNLLGILTDHDVMRMVSDDA